MRWQRQFGFPQRPPVPVIEPERISPSLRDLRLHGDATALQINQRIGHMQPPRNLAYHYARFMAAKKENSRIVTFRSRTQVCLRTCGETCFDESVEQRVSAVWTCLRRMYSKPARVMASLRAWGTVLESGLHRGQTAMHEPRMPFLSTAASNVPFGLIERWLAVAASYLRAESPTSSETRSPPAKQR